MANALAPMRKQMAQAVRSAVTPGTARDAIDHVIAEYAGDRSIANALFIPAALANLAGQIAVHGFEAKVVHAARGDYQDGGSFLGKPWQDAIDAFRSRGIMSDSELSTLLRDYATQSQESQALMLERVQTRVHALLTDALQHEQTFGEFASALEGAAPGLGISTADDGYLQTLFRTSVQSAYGAGRFKSFMDPAVQEARPFVQYRTVGDARVRPEHAILDRTVYRIDDPVWFRIAPPNGFSCRCACTSLSREEADGLHVRDSLPKGYEPDPDFDSPPLS